MRFEQRVQYASATDIGLRRKNNEDAFGVQLCGTEEAFQARGHLFLVADGMGGHAVGELASRLAVETVPHSFFKRREGDAGSALESAIHEANSIIHARGIQNRDFLRMGTTCSALVLSPRGALVGHVGDSRVYRIRRDKIDQLTFDHSLNWELQRQNKKLPEDLQMLDNRNVITRSLGPEAEVDVEMEGPYPVLPGDIYVVCSDGLSGQVADAEIGGVARELEPAQACRLLVHLANLRGGADNCTVVIARIGELPANLAPAPTVDVSFKPADFGWWWLAGFWMACAMLAAGASLLLFGHPQEGAVLTVIGLGAAATLAVAALRKWSGARRIAGDADTIASGPHRTAIAKPSSELVETLCELEFELRRAAQEDGWDIPWERHQQAVAEAAKATRQHRYAKALQGYARAIDVLMSDLPKRRAAVNSARSPVRNDG